MLAPSAFKGIGNLANNQIIGMKSVKDYGVFVPKIRFQMPLR